MPFKLSSVIGLSAALVLGNSPQQLNSLSRQLQLAVDDAMGTQPGTIVVVDVSSRQVLASHNLELASARLIRPGSTLKPFVVLALLDSGKLDANQHYLCKRPLYIGKMRMDCSHTREIAELDADDAIAYSCNSYISQVASRLGPRELVEAFRRAGLDSLTGLRKPESAGHIDLLNTPEGVQLAALGARGIEVTPLELLEAYRKLAQRKQTGNAQQAQPVFDGLEHAVTYGTAHAAYIEGMKVAGKTGTATAPNSASTHGLFVGYAPADQPEIALVVYIPQGHGLDAAALAQPVFAAYAKFAGQR